MSKKKLVYWICKDESCQNLSFQYKTFFYWKNYINFAKENLRKNQNFELVGVNRNLVKIDQSWMPSFGIIKYKFLIPFLVWHLVSILIHELYFILKIRQPMLRWKHIKHAAKIIITHIIFIQLSFLIMYGHHIFDYFCLF
jgi:hypothetical protein